MKKNEVLVELREESLEGYLEKIDGKELDRLYEEALMVTGEKKNKNVKEEDKIGFALSNILSNVVASSVMLVDDDINQLKNILAGKKITSVRNKLLEGNYVFKEEVNGSVCYYMLSDVKEIIEENIFKSNIDDNKRELIVEFYLRSNGVLELEKLQELIKETGFNIKVSELKNLIKSKGHIFEDNMVYCNELAYEVSKSGDLVLIKNENEYKTFSIEEMLASMMMVSMMAEGVSKFLKTKVKNEEELITIVKDICDIIASDADYEELVIEYLDDKKIELSDKQYDKLFEKLLDVYMVTPSWELNGHTSFEMEHNDCDCDCDCHCDDDCDCGCDHDWDWNSDFEDLTKEEKTEVLVNVYLLINGAMRIKDMMELLDLHHGLKVKKSEIINAVKELEDINVLGDYIHINGLEKEEIEMLMSQKDTFGEYKIIEDIDSFFDNFDEVFEVFEDVCLDYDLNEDVYIQVRSVLNMMGILPEEVFDEILKDNNIKMNNKRKLAFIKEVKKVASKFNVWGLNGFSIDELRVNNQDNDEKIGRNDMCPCGSGKKYKKCCGK